MAFQSQYPISSYSLVASAFEVIPRTLAQNTGTDVVRTITELRKDHSSPAGKVGKGNEVGAYMGIDGSDGKIVDMKKANIWDPAAVKIQAIKTAIEVSCMLLRIDDIVSGMKKDKKDKGKSQLQGEEPETDKVNYSHHLSSSATPEMANNNQA